MDDERLDATSTSMKDPSINPEDKRALSCVSILVTTMDEQAVIANGGTGAEPRGLVIRVTTHDCHYVLCFSGLAFVSDEWFRRILSLNQTFEWQPILSISASAKGMAALDMCVHVRKKLMSYRIHDEGRLECLSFSGTSCDHGRCDSRYCPFKALEMKRSQQIGITHGEPAVSVYPDHPPGRNDKPKDDKATKRFTPY